MAKEETAAAPAAPVATERPAGRAVTRKAEQQFWAAARGGRKKRRTGRMFLIVAGIALGASLAATGTVYGPALLGIAAAPPPAPAPAAAVARAPGAVRTPPQGPQPLTGPAQAIDGATLTVAGQTVRLQGVQSPPASLVCRSAALEYPCGDVARRVLSDFAGDAPVACMPAAAAASAGAGVVAVCRNRRGWDLAALQVETGWAIIQGTPDASPYRAEEARARANAAGLWPGFVKPEQWTQTASR
jgi:endonuclease YncB( thermonuclease family)